MKVLIIFLISMFTIITLTWVGLQIKPSSFQPIAQGQPALETMRYRHAEGGNKILWLSEVREWQTINETLVPSTGAAIWLDEGTPWAIFTVDDIVYNVDVDEYIRATSP